MEGVVCHWKLNIMVCRHALAKEIPEDLLKKGEVNHHRK